MKQREFTRKQASGTIVLRSQGGVTAASYSNISAGGALLTETNGVSVGDQVNITVKLRAFQFFNLSAKAVRQDEGRLALQFDKPLSSEQFNLLVAA